MNEIGFKGLAQSLLSRSRDVVPSWLPGGRMRGREYVCGNLRGGEGDSLSVNMDTGKWADFAGDDKGGDLISLYAAIQGIGQADAAKAISENIGIDFSGTEIPKKMPEVKKIEVVKPPAGQGVPPMTHSIYGDPVLYWTYKNSEDEPLFYVARYELDDGKKQIIPWSWSVDRVWVNKGWPILRPLYGLELLAQYPDKPVLIVEGEKTADAARLIVGSKYAVVTWPNGASSVRNSDWQALAGRSILIWPDADEPGKKAASQIIAELRPICNQIKLINPDDKFDGWDAADAVIDGWGWDEFYNWAKPRAEQIKGGERSVKTAQIKEVEINIDESIDDAADIEIESVSGATSEEGKSSAFAGVKTVINFNDSPPLQGSIQALYDSIGVSVNKQGFPAMNADTCNRIFERVDIFKDFAWYDEFHQKYFTTLKTGRRREWDDSDTVDLLVTLQRYFGMQKISKEHVRDSMMVYARQRTRNEPREWMETLTWDGQPRIESFFSEYFGCMPSDYASAASRNWWVSMAARIYKPGCKADNMVILEGKQGKYKSTALNIIGGDWYAESHVEITSKDFYLLLCGKLIIEISELDGFSKAESNTIKKVVSCNVDRYRVPFGSVSQDWPRQCVFVGTTNEDCYLKDNTGARRFWPIKIESIRLDDIRRDRAQLFAEAVKLFKDGATWWEMPSDITEEAQESRRFVDAWEEIVFQYLKPKSEINLFTVATEALKIDAAKFDINCQKRLSKVMRVLGWDRIRKTEGNDRLTVWRSPSFIYEELPF